MALGVALLRVAGAGAGDFLLGVSSFLRLDSRGDSMIAGVVVERKCGNRGPDSLFTRHGDDGESLVSHRMYGLHLLFAFCQIKEIIQCFHLGRACLTRNGHDVRLLV